jgi:tRNA (guanosine-2'-O-)-methyltransferase
VLENFQNSSNVGAVIRSVDALGFSSVKVVQYTNVYTGQPGVSRGSEQWVDTHSYNKMENCIRDLKEKGCNVYYADPSEENAEIYDIDISKPVALIFGQENDGITDNTKKLSDGGFRLPLYGFVESYNVSVSAALTLFTLRHRIQKEISEFKISDKTKKHLFDKWVKRHLDNRRSNV